MAKMRWLVGDLFFNHDDVFLGQKFNNFFLKVIFVGCQGVGILSCKTREPFFSAIRNGDNFSIMIEKQGYLILFYIQNLNPEYL